MRASIRATMLLDDGSDIGSYQSLDPRNDSVWVRLLIGPVESDGAESFDINICTPEWLESEAAREPFFPSYCLVVPHVDLVSAVSFVRRTVDSIEGQDWTEISQQISRFSRWEFESYVA
jgi:immunity protein 8 of polymorphic toxin system